MIPRTFLSTLASISLAAAASADLVTGRVVDAEGAPVAGAEVASFWQFDGGSAVAVKGALSDAEGEFELELEFYGRPAALLAMDAGRTRGGLAAVDPDATAGVVIQLGPLVELSGDFSCEELDAKPTWTNVYMSFVAEPGAQPLRIARCSSYEATFRFALPPGQYQFHAYGRDVQGRTETLTLSADQPHVDRGTIDLEATIIARHYGKAPPALHITEARGIDASTTLADLQGKWVLIEFWGYW